MTDQQQTCTLCGHLIENVDQEGMCHTAVWPEGNAPRTAGYPCGCRCVFPDQHVPTQQAREQAREIVVAWIGYHDAGVLDDSANDLVNQIAAALNELQEQRQIAYRYERALEVQQSQRSVETRRRFIADSELTDIEEETARYYRRKNGEEIGRADDCVGFVFAYIPTLIKELRAMSAPLEQPKEQQ